MVNIRQYPASATSIAALVALTALFWLSGTLLPEQLPDYARSRLQIIGTALMLILLPPYILAALFVMPRRSVDLVSQLRSQLPDTRHADEAVRAIRQGLRSTWVVGAIVGLAMGVMNTQLFVAPLSRTPAIDISLSLGQLVLWLCVGLLIGARLQAARAFSRLGEVVEFDLFRLDRLKPLARSGIVDVVAVVSGMTLTSLQTLDAQFHWYNYRFAVIVLGPATMLLLLMPLFSVHRRIREEKRQRLVGIDEQIGERPVPVSRDEILELETLLAHRERLRDLRTWPLSTALLSRLFLYLIIPPLAWVGAALVETVVTQVIRG